MKNKLRILKSKIFTFLHKKGFKIQANKRSYILHNEEYEQEDKFKIQRLLSEKYKRENLIEQSVEVLLWDFTLIGRAFKSHRNRNNLFCFKKCVTNKKNLNAGFKVVSPYSNFLWPLSYSLSKKWHKIPKPKTLRIDRKKERRKKNKFIL